MLRERATVRAKEQQASLECEGFDDVGIGACEQRIVAEPDVEEYRVGYAIEGIALVKEPEKVAQATDFRTHGFLAELKVVLKPDKHIIVSNHVTQN